MAPPMDTVADAVVRALLASGVQTLFGMPGGGSNLDVLDAAARAGLPFVLAQTETGGALMASAQAEITGAVGGCLATLGPGVASLANGVAHARLDRVPLVVLTDGLPARTRATYAHQRLDHAALLAPLVKAGAVADAETAHVVVPRIVGAASAPPPGPVHLDLPSDVSGREAHAGDDAPSAEAPPADLSGLPDALVARARRPVVIAGLGVRTGREAARLRALCERRGLPVLVTYKGKGTVPDRHPSFAGVFTHAAPDEPFVRSSDLIVGVGLDPVELLPRPWTYPQPFVACGPWPVTGAHVPVAGQASGDLAALIDALEACLPITADWRPDEIRAHAEAQRARVRVETGGFAPYRAAEAAAGAAGPDARVVVDAGAHMFPITTLWPVGAPRQLLISNGLATMGYALPAAIGAALLDRARRVVALTGDGGLFICLGELATLARERLPVTVVVFADRSLSLIRIKQERRGLATDRVALSTTDWPALAQSLGFFGARAEEPAELARRMEEAAATGGPALVEAAVDGAAYGETLTAVRG